MKEPSSVLRPFQSSLILILIIIMVTISINKHHSQGYGGGQLSNKFAWPWMAAISKIVNHSFSLECGGSILNERWILTAAHCLDNLSNEVNILLTFGALNLSQVEPHRVDSFVRKFVLHPNFKEDDTYDIAVVALATPLNFSSTKHGHLRPVCLDFDFVNITNESTCMGIGYGDYNDTYEGQDVLQEVQMKPFDVNTCAQITKEYNKVHNQDIDEKFTERSFCMVSKNVNKTGDGGDDQRSLGGGCSGDSGSPLHCKQGHQWIQVGVFYQAPGCFYYPSGYMKVALFRDFIVKETGYEFPGHCRKSWLTASSPDLLKDFTSPTVSPLFGFKRTNKVTSVTSFTSLTTVSMRHSETGHSSNTHLNFINNQNISKSQRNEESLKTSPEPRRSTEAWHKSKSGPAFTMTTKNLLSMRISSFTTQSTTLNPFFKQFNVTLARQRTTNSHNTSGRSRSPIIIYATNTLPTVRTKSTHRLTVNSSTAETTVTTTTRIRTLGTTTTTKKTLVVTLVERIFEERKKTGWTTHQRKEAEESSRWSNLPLITANIANPLLITNSLIWVLNSFFTLLQI